MDSSLFCFYSSSDEGEECNLTDIRKQIRIRSDPLTLADSEFVKRFRLSKEAFNYVLKEIEFNGVISTSVPPKIQLAAALSLLASGGFQHNVGNDFIIGLSQSAISRLLQKFIVEVETKLCPKFIKFCAAESDECKEYFLRKYKIPGVTGCIDGTHIGLQRPKEKEKMFFNIKTFHSLNSMIICDHEYTILAINSKNGGAAHDSFVWKKSNERAIFVENYGRNLKNGWVLGDSGYPLEPWLLTPYRNPQEGSMESHFNDIHSQARCVVERTIGIWKARWKILCHDKLSRYLPEKIASFTNVCAALHNICIHFKVKNYENIRAPVEVNISEIGNSNETNITNIGKKIRDDIKISLCNS